MKRLVDKIDIIRLIEDWEALEELEKELGMPKEEIIANLKRKVGLTA